MMKTTRVYQDNGSWFYVQDLDERNPKTGRPRQKWHRLCRVDEGEAVMHEKLATLLGEQPAPPAGNMPALIGEYQRDRFGELSFDVRREYERQFAVITKAFVKFNAADVEPGDVLTFLADNFAGKPNTKGKYKARLSAFFSWCVLNRAASGVTVNPCAEIRVKGPAKQRGRMTAAVYWALHDALTPMGRCFLELMFLTRQRPTEIRLLRESAIEPTHIHFVPSKTEASSNEEVYILRTPEINACLERARALRPQRKVTELAKHRDPYLIQTRDGDRYTKNGIYEVWRDAVIAAGCKGVTTRHVRPYALAEMENRGHTVREIQVSAAHSSMVTTEGYLDQYRRRVSDVHMTPPPRPKE